MNHPVLRIAVEFHSVRKPFILSAVYDETRLLQIALSLFNIPESELDDYELLLEVLNCRPTSSTILMQNDILLLKLKSQLIREQKNLVLSFDERNEPKLYENTNSQEGNLEINALERLKIFDDPEEVYSEEEILQIKSNKGSEREDEEEKENYIEDLSEISKSISRDVSSDESEEEQSDCEDEDEEIEPTEEQHLEIKVEEIESEEYDDRKELKTRMKEWSLLQKMNLSFKTGETFKTKENVYQSILYCTKRESKGCNFYLEFVKKEGSTYSLKNYYNYHNHGSNLYNSANEITVEMKNLMIKLQPIHQDAPSITKIINKEFKKNFNYRTIYYQLKKLKNIEYGNANEDAAKLFELLEIDANTRGSFYNFQKDSNNRLLNFCFISQRMRQNLCNFRDVLIVDATHKSNRFGMPLLDVVIVNNLGQTITCFIALLHNQKFESFYWALSNLKTHLEGTPGVIFSDDEDALCQGNYLILLLINF